MTSIQSLAEIVSSNTASRRVQLRMVGALATLAFVLGALGIHGLLSFTTTQRGREIGLRMVLGAEKPSVLWMVLREGVVLGGIGVAVGSVLGLAAASAMQALLFGVPATDPFTFASALAIALSMTMAGSLPPALRAASVDPADVLRGA